MNTIPPFGVYFCRKPTLTALRRDGIHPTSQSTRQGNPLNIALKLQASLQREMSDTTYYSPLKQQRHGLYLFVNLPATLEAGFTWYMLDPQKGIIGPPKVPLPAASSIALSPSNPGRSSTTGFLPPMSPLCTHLATVPLWEHQAQRPPKHISTLTQISGWNNTSGHRQLSKPASISQIPTRLASLTTTQKS